MFGWLANLLERLRPNGRCLFRYWDGSKHRSIDPIVAHRGIWLDEDCQLLEDGPVSFNPKGPDGQPIYPISDVVAAEDRIRTLARKVFGVQEWKEGQPGLTALETDELMNRFIQFCEDLKKKRAPLPTSSVASTCPAPLPSPDFADSPDGLPSDFSSLPIGSNVAAPTGP